MTAAPADYDSLDWGLANQTCFAFASIYPMPELKKSFFAIGVHVIGDGGAAESNRFGQHFLDGNEQLAEVLARNGCSPAARANARPE
jgi:hypothetical protein